MTHRNLTVAWLMLLGLSLGAAWLSEALLLRLVAPSILLLTLIKSWVILSYYLDLRAVLIWRRGFILSLSLFFMVILALYLVATS
ncbi:nitric oxide reductase F protein [Pseudopelagicola sp. nBUS_20]|uniref:hypothetical protein n=1 Tax=Pseudopelagicola sp. nBUS_20 TaxID=3395317 RepID=UPI003EBBF6D5